MAWENEMMSRNIEPSKNFSKYDQYEWRRATAERESESELGQKCECVAHGSS